MTESNTTEPLNENKNKKEISDQSEENEEQVQEKGKEKGKRKTTENKNEKTIVKEPKISMYWFVRVFARKLRNVLVPVTLTMLLVIVLIKITNQNSDTTDQFSQILIYHESSSDSNSKKFGGSLLNAVVIVGVVLVMTVFLVFLIKYNCWKIIWGWLFLSCFWLLLVFGALKMIDVCENLNLAVDWITLAFLDFNFAVVGVIVIFWHGPLKSNQIYTILMCGLVAVYLTTLPTWTTWVLLALIALYDIFVVLSPKGPLKILVEESMKNNKPIPGLIYSSIIYLFSARINPKNSGSSSSSELNSNFNPISSPSSDSGSGSGSNNVNSLKEESSHLEKGESELEKDVENDNTLAEDNYNEKSSLLQNEERKKRRLLARRKRRRKKRFEEESGVKLGGGDLIFYSVLIGKAAYFDYETIFTCWIAILVGLAVTLFFLAVYAKALPALPISIAFGMIFFFLTKIILVPMVKQLGVDSVMT
ncbi:presenilin [Anaeramoeba flamelloides]|uniref:Presenilin n=1 Tax=Anaeramoeba flamelloides TaxID=1746091 RepID=A0AAV8A265_9EUKA|nr:presenilin [Anaeramoeba flamelloides]